MRSKLRGTLCLLGGGTAAVLALACGTGSPEGDLGATSSKILGGTAVPQDHHIPGRWGVRLNGASMGMCSGTLLTNGWVLSATHCFPVDNCEDGCDGPYSINNPPEYNPTADSLTVTAFDSGAAQTSTNAAPMRLVRHPSIFAGWQLTPLSQKIDVAMVRLAAPLSVNGSTTGLTQDPTPIRVSDSPSLDNKILRLQGYGVNADPVAGSDCGKNNQPPFGMPTYPSSMLRVDLTVEQVWSDDNAQTRGIRFVPNANGQLPAPGDSGSGAFYNNGVGYDLVGVFSGGHCRMHADYVAFDSFRTWAISTMYGGWGRDIGWCEQPGQRLLTADLNADNRSDLVCSDTQSGLLYVNYARKRADGSAPVAGFTGVNGQLPDPGLFGATDWQTPTGGANLSYCAGAGNAVFLGDFNGDSRADALCHAGDGNNYIAYAFANGSPGFDLNNLWHDSNPAHIFCPNSLGKLFVDDFSGDGRADLLCHDGATGHNWIAYGDVSGHIDFTNIWADTVTDYCRDATGSIYTGKFDGNSRADIMCHNHTDGRTWIAYTGTNFRPNFSSLFSSTFNFCSGGSSLMRVGDMNGDGRSDLLCHDQGTGSKWIATTASNGQPQFGGAGIHMRWCNEPGDELSLTNFNNDSRADMLCHNRADSGHPTWGRQYVIYNQNGSFSIQ
jgi:hypothetical protein